jgi:hypothetical protein
MPMSGWAIASNIFAGTPGGYRCPSATAIKIPRSVADQGKGGSSGGTGISPQVDSHSGLYPFGPMRGTFPMDVSSFEASGSRWTYRKETRMRRIAIGATLALGLTLGGASTAFAGEYNGKGDPIVRGGQPASACSYSGQDQSDDFEDNGPNGEGDDDFVTVPGKGTSTNPSGVRVQNWGQYVVFNGGGKGSGVPGQECRGN